MNKLLNKIVLLYTRFDIWFLEKRIGILKNKVRSNIDYLVLKNLVQKRQQRILQYRATNADMPERYFNSVI